MALSGESAERRGQRVFPPKRGNLNGSRIFAACDAQQCTRVSHNGFQQECILQECPARVSRQSVLQECPTRLFRKNFRQEWPTRLSYKSVPQECPTSVVEGCPTRVFYRSVPQECCIEE